ncbi:hypothetical protein M8120_08130 [Microcystis aeruginosa str. Chao 1910]|uniref:hypothetical protein n=1 Tax=Microcystis aeruginosa TaxID=1126 RepID=UPI002245BEC5|nr:hypothetical protein [Microcystis aeruginosa]UZO77864.1 hypothetical protein M8120_08130 [Microcystis aeruginosa str. Chao 1910]
MTNLPYFSFYFPVSPDEKIFTPTEERGFLPYTPHPKPSFQSGDRRLFLFILPSPHFLIPQQLKPICTALLT